MKNRIKELNDWIKTTYDDIEKMDSPILKSNCYYSVLEMFSEEYCGYSKPNSNKNFAAFLMKFSNESEWFHQTKRWLGVCRDLCG